MLRALMAPQAERFLGSLHSARLRQAGTDGSGDIDACTALWKPCQLACPLFIPRRQAQRAMSTPAYTLPHHRTFGGLMLQGSHDDQPQACCGHSQGMQGYENGDSMPQRDGMATDVAQQQSMSSLEGEREPLGDSDYKQPGLDFMSDDDDSEVSDDSRPGHGRKRKRRPEQEPEPERPDTEMRQKLRQRSAEEGAWQDADANGISRSASADFEVDPDAPAVLARNVDGEQEEEERRWLQRSWEMATILDFLELFRPYLNLSRGFTVHELESVLILSPGGEGLLGSLHIDLMRGISQRSTITPQNWTMYLSERLKQRWRMSREWDPPPFSPRRNREAMEYSVLPLIDRVQALKALCEIRLEKDDIVGLIEDAIKPCKATRQAAKQTGVWPSLDDFRREPLGEDSSGLIYHYFDLHLSPEGEGRLYRETPAALTKAKPPKGRGAAAWEPQDGPWELLGTTSDELTEIGEKLQRSKKDQDRTLAVKILEGIVPGLLRKKEEEEKRLRVAQRMQRQMDNIMLDENGGFGRARRQRKQIDYSGNAYDNMMRAAIMRQGRQEEEANRRRMALPDDRPSDAEAAKLGMRRGRSAYNAEPIQWDAGLPLERRARGAASSKADSAAPSAPSGAASMEGPQREPEQTEQSSQQQDVPELKEETWQQASEPKEEPKPVPQADAEPAVQQNGSSWTHIEPVKQESKPVVRFNPLPKEEDRVSEEAYMDDYDEPLPKWSTHQARTVM